MMDESDDLFDIALNNVRNFTPEQKEERTELAKRLAAAFLSCHLGIGLEYTLRQYVPEDPGELWYTIAEMVRALALMKMDRFGAELAKKGKKEIVQ